MNFRRGLIRLFLAIILITSLFVLFKALLLVDSEKANAWSAIAASLAVVTAIVSAWSAQKVIELQEDAQKPYPYLYFDVSSRYQLILLAINNSGSTPAYNISIIWDTPLINLKGKNVSFSNNQQPEIPVLNQNEMVSTLVNTSSEIFEGKDLNYSGKISYYNSSNEFFQREFKISLEQYRNTLLHSEESVKTNYELQKLPDALGKIENELKKIRNTIDSLKET